MSHRHAGDISMSEPGAFRRRRSGGTGGVNAWKQPTVSDCLPFSGQRWGSLPAQRPELTPDMEMLPSCGRRYALWVYLAVYCYGPSTNTAYDSMETYRGIRSWHSDKFGGRYVTLK